MTQELDDLFVRGLSDTEVGGEEGKGSLLVNDDEF